MNTETQLPDNENPPPFLEGNASCDASAGADIVSSLTEEGRTWLHAPVNLEPGAGTTNEVAAAIGTSFNISPIEALTAVVGALSLAVGPGTFSQNPFGTRLPVSLQLWVRVGTNPNFDRAVRFLCREVIDAYSAEFGPAIHEDENTLAAEQLEIETSMSNRASAVPRWGAVTITPTVPAALQKEEQADILKYYRIFRRRASFPFGNVVSSSIISELMADNGDFCFGSFSPDGGALRHILETSLAERTKILSFLNAGFDGELFTQNLDLPVYPVTASVWLSSPELIDAAISKGIHIAMPGALVVASERREHGIKPTALAVEHRDKWRHLLTAILRTFRLAPHRRYKEASQGDTCLLDADATDEFTEALEWERLATGPSHAQSLLAKAPEQILKIAALLNIEPISTEVIGRNTILRAMEIFRWLARGTLQAVAGHQARDLPHDIERVVAKLRTAGPMSLRSITRSFHRMTYERASMILLRAIQSGSVKEDQNLYRAIP